MAQDKWSSKQYLKFENERTRPVRDLLVAVPVTAPRQVVDLGCGPGNSTEVLAQRFPSASIAGLDSSADMIEAARKRMPQVQFEVADILTWQAPGPYDVILSNAVFQWVPGHETLFPALAGKLAEGGSVAIQMPDTQEEPPHRMMRELAAQGPWADKLKSVSQARTALRSADWYYGLLAPHCSQVDIWRTTYYHVLEDGPSAIVEWFKGSALRPFLDPLDETERRDYLNRYTEMIAKAYPPLQNGAVLLPFPRLFIVATR
ncbi:trans-aconitate 2-methyltransferase [Bordetella genomosp. 9]|uniref:Trans-aconitate 2-methyltransferase n=1 Tax=Bordetella genomosp. 9 TaxID=1416803 RepID=A0A1W6YV61_9BORD|nr:trans-aconitate 2-methyltransferase [Bordetella genomosp. 9]ARP84992.1 trans-aconitate 2-methyltransferase [Bordetella genomosp. 9]